jgi:hypothetical protein
MGLLKQKVKGKREKGKGAQAVWGAGRWRVCGFVVGGKLTLSATGICEG